MKMNKSIVISGSSRSSWPAGRAKNFAFFMSEERVVTLPDTSVNGVLIWITMLGIVALFAVILFEYVRNHPRFQKVYYTRMSNAASTRIAVPVSHFGWIRSVFSISEEAVLDEVGLDAVMYLRFLAMCFSLFAILMFILFIILIPVNYYASTDEVALNITLGSGTILEVANSALSSISMSQIQNGSSIFWVHCVCAYIVSGVVFYFLHKEYRHYVITTARCLREPKDHLDRIQQRTILITNLPKHLRTKLALEKWLLGIDIGRIQSIYMNTKQDGDLLRLLSEFKSLIYKLERAYMQWAINIYKMLHFPRVSSVIRLGASARLKLIENSIADEDKERSIAIADQCRPLYISQNKTEFKKRDVIKYLTKRVKELENQILQKRMEKRELLSVTAELPEDLSLDRLYEGLNAHSASAFVTFRSNRAVYTALQMKLDSSMDGYSMLAKPAPLPNDVMWNNLTKSLWDRKVKRGFLSLLSMGICVGWVIPTYFISTLSFIGLPAWIDTNPFLAMIAKSVVPPVLILTCATLITYVLDCNTN
jgi:Trk K+ transport system NAD-binding subunit